MKKEKMVTRTFKLYEVTVLAVDTDTAEVHNETVNVTRLSGKEEKDLKFIQPLLSNENSKAVKIVNVETKEEVYGMSELDFIASAKIITRPPSQRASKED